VTVTEPFVRLGKIVATHGLGGWLKLNAFNPETHALSEGTEVLLERAPHRSAHRLEGSRRHQRQFIVKLSGIDSIDDAESYVGSTLAVAESALEPLETRQYYHYQVVGFEVCHVNGNRIGILLSTMPTPGGELYVVQGDDAKEHLIPAVREIIECVDFNARRVTVNPPEGLLDL